jgi:hypothetical protein
LGKSIENFEKNPQKFNKPLAKANEKLIEACCFPIKTDKIDEFLETWYISSRWTVQAKAFIEDKLPDDVKEDPSVKEEVIWTFDRANDLLNQA